jgi:hypothetical protein
LVPAALIVVVAATLGVVGVLLGRTDMGRDLFGAVGDDPGGAGAALTVIGVDSFDPFGSGGEHDDELATILDPDPATVWTSEEYRSRDLGGLKPGVGIVLTLDQAVELGELRLDSPTQGWGASVYVADDPAPELDGWGAPVDTAEGIGGDATFDLGGRAGGAVLVFITDLGDGTVGPRFSAAVGGVELKPAGA